MRILDLMVAAAIVLPQATSAQSNRTYWRIPSTIGGAMVGAGVGWAGDIARWRGEDCGLCGPTLTLTPVGMGVGAVIGFVSGLDADGKLREGDSLSVARRRWLRFSTFLTPAAIGSTLAFLVINPSDYECVPDGPGICTYRESDKIMSDETAALLGIGGGIIGGWILQNKTKGALRPRVSASTGSLGMSFSYSF
jgi:hypothetical protein